VSVLLLEAHGFEGFGSSRVRVEPDNLAVADSEDGGDTAHDLLSTPFTKPAITVEQKHLLSEVDGFFVFDSIRDPRRSPA
jgi:hypothetical protein